MVAPAHPPATPIVANGRPSPALALSDVRVDVGGGPAVDGLTLTSTGYHILVLGAPRALFEAAAGLRPTVRGRLLVEGVPVSQAIRAGLVACAPLDPTLPGGWTARQYVAWSARLAGQDRATSLALAEDALERLRIAPLARTKLGAALPHVRRAVVIAAALATGAATLLAEDPTPGLRDEEAHALARATTSAVGERRSIVFAARVPLESPLALDADEAIVITGSQVGAQGAPAEIAASERTLAVRIHGDLAAFVGAVEAQGGHAVAASDATPPVHVRVDLGPLEARDLLRIAAESNAIVVELRPLARAFA
jgi:iron complex transport system ATP-binding protein